MAGLLELPAKLALPAAVAAGAYLNGKFGVASDLYTLWHSIGVFALHMKQQERKDRLNIFYCFEDLAKSPKTANRVFLIVPKDGYAPDDKTEWTYAEAYQVVLKYAAWLKYKQHVQKEEVIAMDFTNRPQFIWVWFALWSLGAIPAFINHNLRDQAFLHCVRISASRLLLVEDGLRETLTDDVVRGLDADEKGRAVETVVIEPEIEREILAQTPYRAPNEARSGAHIMSTAMLIYTSGTTGLPKAAAVQWGKPWSGVRLFSTFMGIRSNDHYLTALPLYHSSGSILGVLQVLNTAAAVVVCPKFSPRTFMRYVHETKATGIHYIGEMCRYLVASPPTPYDQAHNVRWAYGNGLQIDIWQRFKDRFNIANIVEFYGATEGVGGSYVYSRNSFLQGAIGRRGLLLRQLLPGTVMVKHDSANDLPYRDPSTGFCVRCETGEPGELLSILDAEDINSKYLGYYGNDKASMSKVLRNVFKTGDAYYRSGDLQKIDSEGRVWFVDRIGDTFRWKGENVSTLEVSQKLGTHRNVSEANVYGVELPGSSGRAGCAAIVLSRGQSWDERLAKDLADHARQSLPQYAVPIFLRLMPQVEVTGTLKHQKVELRKQGVDPSKTKGDEMYWLERGAERYTKFDESCWQKVLSGDARL